LNDLIEIKKNKEAMLNQIKLIENNIKNVQGEPAKSV
jgi:hypothetical protein